MLFRTVAMTGLVDGEVVVDVIQKRVPAGTATVNTEAFRRGYSLIDAKISGGEEGDSRIS